MIKYKIWNLYAHNDNIIVKSDSLLTDMNVGVFIRLSSSPKTTTIAGLRQSSQVALWYIPFVFYMYNIFRILHFLV